MEHTNNGKIALIFGILSMVLLIPIYYAPIIFGILAIVFGASAKKNDDNYGTYGIFLGVLSIILTIVLTTIFYLRGGSLF